MAIKFGDGSTQNYASTVVASYNTLLTDRYYIVGSSNEQVVWTGGNRSLPGTNCQHIIMARLDMGGKYGGAYKVQYSTDNGSNWNNVGTIELGDIDNGTGQNMVAMGAYHLNYDNHGHYSIGTGQGFFWKYDVNNNTQSRLRISMSPYSSTSQCSINRRAFDTSYNSISHIMEYIVQET